MPELAGCIVAGIVAVTLVALGLAGCQSGSVTQTASLVGGISSPTTTVAMALPAGKIGRDLNRSDRGTALAAEYRALEYGRTGATTPWSDRLTGRYGEVVPGAAYRVNDYDLPGIRPHDLYRTATGKPPKAPPAAATTEAGEWSASAACFGR